MRQINQIEELGSIKEYYYITTCGKVISTRDGRVKVLKSIISTGEYSYVNLYTIDSKLKHMRIHRLVALAFIPNTENKTDVNHKNEIKSDNYVQNLEWCTREENINHGTRNKRAGEKIGESLKGRQLSEETKKKLSEALKGDKSPKSKPREYFAENPCTKFNFKTICKKQNWNFEDFIEVDSGEKCWRHKKYYYIYKE